MRLNKEDRRKINRYLEQYYNRYMKSAIVDAGDSSNQKYYLGLYVGACNLLKMLGLELTPFSNITPTQLLEETKND